MILFSCMNAYHRVAAWIKRRSVFLLHPPIQQCLPLRRFDFYRYLYRLWFCELFLSSHRMRRKRHYIVQWNDVSEMSHLKQNFHCSKRCSLRLLFLYNKLAIKNILFKFLQLSLKHQTLHSVLRLSLSHRCSYPRMLLFLVDAICNVTPR